MKQTAFEWSGVTDTALAQRASRLDFREVETVDADLGSSAAVGAKRREGFERLLGAVALGEAGNCRVFRFGASCGPCRRKIRGAFDLR